MCIATPSTATALTDPCVSTREVRLGGLSCAALRALRSARFRAAVRRSRADLSDTR